MAAEGRGSHKYRCELTSVFYTAWLNLGIVPIRYRAIRCSSRMSALRLSQTA